MAAGLAALLLIAVVLVEGRSVVLFGTIAPWSAPATISFCDRDYRQGELISPSAAADLMADPAFEEVTRGPLWQPVYAQEASAELRDDGGPCALSLYVRDGDRLRVFPLLGGP